MLENVNSQSHIWALSRIRRMPIVVHHSYIITLLCRHMETGVSGGNTESTEVQNTVAPYFLFANYSSSASN